MSSTMGRITNPPDLHLLFEGAEQRYLDRAVQVRGERTVAAPAYGSSTVIAQERVGVCAPLRSNAQRLGTLAGGSRPTIGDIPTPGSTA